MTEEKNWNKLTLTQLKAELANRGVTETSWKRSDLVERLTKICNDEVHENDADSEEEDILIIDESHEDKKETGIAMNGTETITEPVAKEVKDRGFPETRLRTTKATSCWEKEKPDVEEGECEPGVEEVSDGEETADIYDFLFDMDKKDEEENGEDKNSKTISKDNSGQMKDEEENEEDVDSVTIIEDDIMEIGKREPGPSDETKAAEAKTEAAEAKTEAAEESEKKDADKKTPELKKIHYRVKKIEKRILQKIVCEAHDLMHVTMFPIKLTDLERPDIRECLDRCNTYNVNFINESSTGTSWHGLLEMDFKTIQDAFDAKDKLRKIGPHFTILHRPSKNAMKKSMKSINNRKQPILKPQIEKLLCVEGLPKNVRVLKIQKEFPQANLVIIPIIDGKKASEAYVNFPDTDTMVKATTEKNQVLQLGGKSCNISVVSVRGGSLSQELRQTLFGTTCKPKQTPKPAEIEKRVHRPRAVRAINTQLHEAEMKYNALTNKRGAYPFKLQKQIDELSYELLMAQTASKDDFDDEHEAWEDSCDNEQTSQNNANTCQPPNESRHGEQDTTSNYEILDMDLGSDAESMDSDAVTLQPQSQQADGRMANPRDSHQQQLGVYGSGVCSIGMGNSRSFPRNIPSSADERMDSRRGHGDFGNGGGQHLRSSTQRSDEGHSYGDRNTRNYGGSERHDSGDRRKQEEGDSKTVNLLMQLSSILGTHLERQELQMEEIRERFDKVSEARGRGLEKECHTSPHIDRRSHDIQDKDGDSEPCNKKSKVDDNDGRSGFNQREHGFNPQNRGFNHQDRGFNPQDHGVKKQNGGFNSKDSHGSYQKDSGFNQHYQGFNQKDHCFKNQAQSSESHSHGFNQSDSGLKQEDHRVLQQTRGFSLQDQLNQQNQSLNQLDHCLDQIGQRFQQQNRGFNQQDLPVSDESLEQMIRGNSLREHGYTSPDRGYNLQDKSLSQQERGFTSRDHDLNRRGLISQGFGSSDSDMQANTAVASRSSDSNYGNQCSMVGVSHSSSMNPSENRHDNKIQFSSSSSSPETVDNQGSKHFDFYPDSKKSTHFQGRGTFQ